jgi:hypothetical protein
MDFMATEALLEEKITSVEAQLRLPIDTFCLIRTVSEQPKVKIGVAPKLFFKCDGFQG